MGLIQQNRLFTAKQVCSLLRKRSDFGKSAQLCIIYEDILRQTMNNMMKNMSKDAMEAMDNERNENDEDFMDLPDKIWAIRCKIDSMYSEQIDLFGDNVQLHIAYCLSLWRIGYNSKGIESKSNEWIKYNKALLNESKYFLSRSNAFINDGKHKKALFELENALKLCLDGKENEKNDLIQTRLLMAVTLNKMNKLKR